MQFVREEKKKHRKKIAKFSSDRFAEKKPNKKKDKEESLPSSAVCLSPICGKHANDPPKREKEREFQEETSPSAARDRSRN